MISFTFFLTVEEFRPGSVVLYLASPVVHLVNSPSPHGLLTLMEKKT